MALINLANINSSSNIKTENKEVSYTANGEYTVEPSEEVDAIKDIAVHVDVPGGQELVWDVDGMTYSYSTITEFPKWYRFAPRTGMHCYNMFANCSSLTSLDLSSFDTSNVTNMDNMFYKCSNLQTITKGSFKNLKVSLNLSPCVVLSKQSVVDLFDSIGTANSGAKITLDSAVYSQLSSDEIKVATGKGWTIKKIINPLWQ